MLAARSRMTRPERQLLDLLDEAAATARLLTEPRTEPPGVGYFDDPGDELARAIDTVARHDGPITVFAGAGVSMEAGLPSWRELVGRLLDDLGADLGPDERAVWVDEILREGPLAAAATARALHPDEPAFRRALRRALYGDRPAGAFAPETLARELARLKAGLGDRVALLTANYDGLLEAALADAGLHPASPVSGRAEAPGRAAVWHLHGRLIPGADPGPLVLTEGDYVRSASEAWPQDFVAERLRTSLCLFVGLSLTDPNFIRWLYRHGPAGDHPHMAVFVRQDERPMTAAVRARLEAATAARWSQSGITPVWTNYYGEVAQLVHEIALRCADPATPPFRVRAARHLAAGRDLVVPRAAERFRTAQHDLSDWLVALVADVRDVAREAGASLPARSLGLGLWGADHVAGVAELWATSERALLGPEGLEQRPMHPATPWVGIETILRGTPVEQDLYWSPSRWRFVRGVPLTARDGPRRTPAGAMTLTCTLAPDACPLSEGRAPAHLLPEIDRLLAGSAAGVFDP
jgi:hypothetical protein